MKSTTVILHKSEPVSLLYIRKHVDTRKSRLPFQVNGLTFGGAFSTALEPLCRHLVAAFGTLQAKKRRDISAFQPLLMGFFELILMQGNSFCEEPVFFGSVWIIHMEAFTNSVKLVE